MTTAPTQHVRRLATPREVQSRERITITSYEHVFDYVHCPSAGFSFPTLEDGTLLPLEHEIARFNYTACLDGTYHVRDRGIRRLMHSYMQPRVIQCCDTPDPADGQVELSLALCNTCPSCHTDYNYSGQRLAPRDQWTHEDWYATFGPASRMAPTA